MRRRQLVVVEGEAARAVPVVEAPAFAGRGHELAALAEALANGPAVVLVEGEAGVGKTRLMQELLASPGARQSTALLANCPPFRQPLTLGPVVDALRRAVPNVGGLGLTALAGALRPLFPEWAADLPPALEPAQDSTAARHRLLSALAELLDRLAVDVFVLEDAHWADEATVELLLYLASSRPRRVSLLVTSRAGDVPADSLLPRLARQATGSSGMHLTLDPLSLDETAHLVSSMLAGEQVSGAFVSFLYERTEGLPLAVEESIRLMAARGDLLRWDGGWARRHLENIPVPHSVRESVLERMSRLSEDAQAVLEAAAVLASPAPEPLLAAVAGLAADHASDGLCEALACRLLSEDDRGLVAFRHTLACQAVYEAIPAPQRRMLHRRAGLGLEADDAPLPVVRLVRHFRESGDTGKWATYALQIVDLALASGDDDAAVDVLCELISGGGDSGFRAARQLDKTGFGSVDDPVSYSRLIEALRLLLASGTGEADEMAQVRFQLGLFLGLMGDQQASRTQLEQAIPKLASDPVRAVRAMTLLGWPHDATSLASEHRQWLDRAAQLEAPLGPAVRLRVLVQRASALLCLGEEQGWAVAASIPATSADNYERQMITIGHANIGDAAMMWGRYAEARNRLARGAELAEQYGYPRDLKVIRANQAHLDWLTGKWDGLAERAHRFAHETATLPTARLDTSLVISLIDAANGEHAAAEHGLQAVVDEHQRRGQIPYLMEPAAALASVLLATGRTKEALQATELPMTLITQKRIWVWGTDLVPARTSALIAAGRVDEASELVAAFAGGLRGRDAPAPKAALTLCRAILADTRGEHARAVTLFGRAASAWQALPRPYDSLLARERQAICLLAAGASDEAISLLEEVLPALSRLGAKGDARRVASTMRQHGAQTRHIWQGGTRGYGHRLSPREQEVVQLAVAGRTNREIGHVLSRSPKTVATQMSSAMRKLGVSSRTDLAAALPGAGPENQR